MGARPVEARRGPRGRRHVDRVRRRPPDERQTRRGEGPAPEPLARAVRGLAVPRRGAGVEQGRSPRRGLRHRRRRDAGWCALHRDGEADRRLARSMDRAAGPARPPRSDDGRRSVARRARVRTSRRRHPSRREAGQHLRHRARRGEARRLRHRTQPGPRATHADRRDHGHAGVHAAGAGGGTLGRRRPPRRRVRG